MKGPGDCQRHSEGPPGSPVLTLRTRALTVVTGNFFSLLLSPGRKPNLHFLLQTHRSQRPRDTLHTGPERPRTPRADAAPSPQRACCFTDAPLGRGLQQPPFRIFLLISQLRGKPYPFPYSLLFKDLS